MSGTTSRGVVSNSTSRNWSSGFGGAAELLGGQAREVERAAHAAAGVEDQAHRYRLVVHGELRDGLLDAVVVDAEVLALQAGDGAVQRIVHAHRNQHELGIDAQRGARSGSSGSAGGGRFAPRLDRSLGREKRGAQRAPQGRTGEWSRAPHIASIVSDSGAGTR